MRRHLRHLSRLAALAAALPALLQAQALATTSQGTAKLLQADYAVPDAPALKMLGLEDSKLLRPASVRELTAALSSASGAGTYLPSALAVEFAPFMLRRGERLTLDEYQRSPLKYRLRASVAASRDTTPRSRSRVAAALRMSFDDESDLRTNERVVNTILALTRWERDSALAVRGRWVANGIPFTGPTNAADSARAKQLEQEVVREQARSSAQLVENAKRAQEEARWNASVSDAAIGVSASANDSAGRGGRLDGVAGWFTRGWPLGEGRQLLVGARGAYERDLADSTAGDLEGSGDVTVRLYVGSNRYKALGEVQGSARAEQKPRWLGNLGGELQLATSIWVTATIGYTATGDIGRGSLVSNWKFKFTPPGD